MIVNPSDIATEIFDRRITFWELKVTLDAFCTSIEAINVSLSQSKRVDVTYWVA